MVIKSKEIKMSNGITDYVSYIFKNSKKDNKKFMRKQRRNTTKI